MHKLQQLLVTTLLAIFITSCGTSVKLDPTATNDENQDSALSFAVDAVDLTEADLLPLTRTNTAMIFYFDFDDYSVKYSQLADLTKHSEFLRKNPKYRLILEGHTDQRGASEYNLALGQKRANSIQSHLQNLGIKQYRLESISYGKERPAINQFNEQAFAKNRRVKLRYVTVRSN